MNKQSIQPAIAELERLFDAFNKELYAGKLPFPAITIQTTGNRNAYGWFWAETWESEGKKVHELNMSAEYLSRDVEDICETLLHEMVHLYCHENGIHDCKNNYHNKSFKEACAYIRLNCEKGSRNGFSLTSLSDDLLKLVRSVRPKKSAFKVFRSASIGPKRQAGSKLKKYSCPGCLQNVRVGTLPENFPGIICAECDEEYLLME